MNHTFYTSPEEPREPVLLPADTPDPAETRRHFSKLGLAYLVLTLAFIGAANAIQLAILYLYPALFNEWWLSWAISLIPLYGAGLPLLWLMLKHVPAAPHNTHYTVGHTTAEKPAFHVGHWMILLIIAIGCMTAGGILGNIVMNLLSAVMGYDYAFALNSMVDESPLWVTFLCTCICAPLGEELLFRKLLLDRTRRYGDLPGILLSGLLFGLFHGNLFQFFYAALVGMLLAYVYTRSGNYWACVAMHAVVNLMGSVVTPALLDMLPADMVSFTSPLQPLIYLFLLVWQYGMLIAGIVLVCALWKRRKLSRGTSPLAGQSRRAVLMNPGMLLAIAAMLALMVINLIPIA